LGEGEFSRDSCPEWQAGNSVARKRDRAFVSDDKK
jgi:hypothetical protein